MEGSSILLSFHFFIAKRVFPEVFVDFGSSLHSPSLLFVPAHLDFSPGVLSLSRSTAVDNTGDILK